ncbi:hypothetical protein SprV_0902797400 [Sparganum proliferum]
MLLVNVPGPMSFQQLKSVNGVTHTTFRGACQALNFLDNDQHWDVCINDACNTSHPRQIRTLFAIILTACSPSSPAELWEKYKSHMAEDILCRQRKQSTIVDFSPDIYNEALIMIEDMCTEIANKVLDQLGMPSPNRSAAASLHVDLRREENYNTLELLSYLQSNIPKLTLEQKGIYDQIMVTANNGVGGILFLDAPGGTGKTFLLRLILTAIRSKNDIAVALASSGIAATLLPGGRTAHSALKLPLNVHFVETPMCNISKSSGMGKVLQKCKLIVWDECTMAHKKALEALDRTLQDLRGSTRPFGGVLLLLAGDFRQTLPVIPRATPADEINACLKYSSFWCHVQKLKLTTNMRVQPQIDRTVDTFSQQLLAIGNGTVPVDPTSGRIAIPPAFGTLVSSKEELVEKVFPNIQFNYTNHAWLSERAILAAKNKDVHQLNHIIQSRIPGEAVVYTSINSVVDADEAVNYPTEFLNSLDLPGMPPHVLRLKIGVPIIMLRNISQPKLCNGTRLAKLKLTTNMRVQPQTDRTVDTFSQQLLAIGNGTVPVDPTSGRIAIPPAFGTLVSSKEELVEKVFPNIQFNYTNNAWLSERAILAAKNKDVHQLNHIIQSRIPGEAVVYTSINSVVDADEAVNYPTEFLNSLDLPGMPPHVLRLKIGVPIIMLRNISQPKLCNGMRLAGIVTQCQPSVVQLGWRKPGCGHGDRVLQLQACFFIQQQNEHYHLRVAE